MRISELIAALETFKRDHGDLVVVAQDGCDPSDPMPVSSVKLLKREETHALVYEDVVYLEAN